MKDLAKDKRGYLQTNQQLQVYKQPESPEQEPTVVENVWAMGDCAQIKDHFLPATAQVSKSQLLFKSHFVDGGTSRSPTNRESFWPKFYPVKSRNPLRSALSTSIEVSVTSCVTLA